MNWKADSDIDSFINDQRRKVTEDLGIEFPSSSGGILGNNLEFILNKIFGRLDKDAEPRILNILVFFRRVGSHTEPEIKPSEPTFEKIVIDYSTIEDSFLFDMDCDI
jgi:hypothetical protein